MPSSPVDKPYATKIINKIAKKSNRKLNIKDLLLVDSGGQYKWGTTDVTRTISFNKPNKKIKIDAKNFMVKSFKKFFSFVFEK